jgi:hypothetical protein
MKPQGCKCTLLGTCTSLRNTIEIELGQNCPNKPPTKQPTRNQHPIIQAQPYPYNTLAQTKKLSICSNKKLPQPSKPFPTRVTNLKPSTTKKSYTQNPNINWNKYLAQTPNGHKCAHTSSPLVNKTQKKHSAI